MEGVSFSIKLSLYFELNIIIRLAICSYNIYIYTVKSRTKAAAKLRLLFEGGFYSKWDTK